MHRVVEGERSQRRVRGRVFRKFIKWNDGERIFVGGVAYSIIEGGRRSARGRVMCRVIERENGKRWRGCGLGGLRERKL